nr:growth arrest specific protein 8 [Hymenolepis microstoma]
MEEIILLVPPKKAAALKKKTKKGSKKKQLNVVDAKPLSEMTHEELEAHVDRVCMELERERADRNLLQLERDRIYSFWSTTKVELENRSAELRVAQEIAQKTAERHERDITAYRLKVRQIEASHANQLAEVKADMEVAVGLAAQEASAGISRPRLKEEALRKEADDHNELVKQLKMDHEKELTKLQQDYEQQSEAERLLYMEKTKELEERLDLQRRMELQATEERKNAFIEEMLRNHEKAFIEMKNYYNTITATNINLIDELKIQLEEKQKQENRFVKENGEHVTRNQFLEDELSIYQRECANLKRLVENHGRDVKALKRAKMEIRNMKSIISNTKMDNEILHQRLKSVEDERNELYVSFRSLIKVVKQNCGVKNILLERQIVSLSEELEKVDIVKLIREEAMKGSFDIEVLSTKNKQIKELQFELARACKANNDLMRTFKQTMKNYGIESETLDNVLINCGKSRLGKGLIPISLGSYNFLSKCGIQVCQPALLFLLSLPFGNPDLL